MNTRQDHLLQALVEVDHAIPVKALAHCLSCSEKTVRLDIRVINENLNRDGFTARIVGKPGSGVRLVIENKREKSLLELRVLEAEAQTQETHSENRARALLLLAMQPNHYTIETLARKLYTNKQKLREDMRHWQRALSLYQVGISKKPRLSLTGDEQGIRLVVVTFAYIQAPEKLQRDIDRELLTKHHLAFFDCVRNAVEQQRHLRLSSNAQNQVSIFLEVCLRRIQAGCPIQPQTEATSPWVEALEQQAQYILGVKLGADELIGMARIIELSARRWDHTTIAAFTPSEEAQRVADHLRDELERRFGVTVDEHLQKPLTILLELALLHRGYRYPLPNPNKLLAKVDHMEQFLILTSIIHNDPTLNAAGISGSDCARLCLLLLETLEKVDIQRHYRAALVTNFGIDQVVYSTYRLKKLLPAIDVVAVLSEEDLQGEPDEPLEDVEFLILFSSMPCSLPSVVISNAVSERDASYIASLAASLDNNSMVAQPPLRSLMKRALVGDHLTDVLATLHTSLFRAKVYRGTRANLIDLFFMQKADRGRIVVFPALCAQVAKTEVRIHPVNCPELEATHMAVLLISEEDFSNVVFIVQRFKLLVKLLDAALEDAT